MYLPDTVTIHVTPDDIAQGVRFEPDRCPVALATERHLGACRIQTGPERIQAWGRVILGPPARYRASPALWKAAREFDFHGTFRPRRFVLRRMA